MGISPALAKKIAEAKTSGGGNNIKDGKYDLIVKKILVDQMFNGTMFIAEFEVQAAKKTHDTVDPNSVGSECSFALNLDTNKSALGNAKSFLFGLFNLDEASTSNDDFMTLIQEYAGEKGSEASLKARGMIVKAATFRKVTKTGPNAGKEGVYPKWEGIEQTEGEIAERRKILDSKTK